MEQLGWATGAGQNIHWPTIGNHIGKLRQEA
jgi:hypothetical protein